MKANSTVIKKIMLLKHVVLFIALFYLDNQALLAQTTPTKIWDKTFGGNDRDQLTSLVKTPDGGFLLGGSSASIAGGDKTEGLRGVNDYWIVKLDVNGSKIWDKRFGGDSRDELTSIITTLDGGFLLGGSSASNAGGDKTQNTRTDFDYWVVKLDANGIKIWDRRFGGSWVDKLSSLVSTPDGGFLLGGWSISSISGDKTENPRGFDDYWVVKIDAEGSKVWDKRFGGGHYDQLSSLVTTPDGGFLLGGSSASNADVDKTEDTRGSDDYWVVKIDVNGNKIWDKRFGGSNRDQLTSLIRIPNDGYLLGGTSISNVGGDKTEDPRGDADYWVVKIDVNGSKIWDKRFGGNSRDELSSMITTPDGGFLLGGSSRSSIGGDITEASKGGNDYWVVKIDANGNKIWDKRIGGSIVNFLSSLVTTPDGGYLLGGSSYSNTGGDKTEDSRGYDDYWVVKIKEAGPLSANDLAESSKIQTSVYPNPGSGNINLVVQGLKPYNSAAHLIIYNSVGKCVLQQTSSVRQMQTGMKLLTAGFPKGVYQLQLLIKDKVITKKLLIN